MPETNVKIPATMTTKSRGRKCSCNITRDRAHLANGRNFAGPIRLDLHFAIEQMQDNRADEDDGVAGDDENGKPRRKSSVIRVKFAPVRDTQRDDAAEE